MNFDPQEIMISALQHFAFCPRQCALIHLEKEWVENRYTTHGKIVHEKTDSGKKESRPGLYIVRSLHLSSTKYGLTGVADVVEFKKAEAGISLPKKKGLWMPFPVEYKRGKRKVADCDRIQLCAQALCLEEMLGLELTKGSLWYFEECKREWVDFDDSLRLKTKTIIQDMRVMMLSQKTPSAKYEKRKCDHCSLKEFCFDGHMKQNKVEEYYQKLFEC